MADRRRFRVRSRHMASRTGRARLRPVVTLFVGSRDRYALRRLQEPSERYRRGHDLPLRLR